MKKMKIKLTHLIIGLNSGGAEHMLYKLLKEINKELFDIKVISLTTKGFYGEKIEELGIELIALNLQEKKRLLQKMFVLYKYLKRTDVLQTWMYHSDLIGLIIGKLARVKQINWGIRRSDLSLENTKKRTIQIAKICSYFSKRVDNIISCSIVGKDSHVKFGYNKENMIVIPNGFDTNYLKFKDKVDEDFFTKYNLSPTKTNILMIARWDAIKDHKTFLQAFKSVNNRCPETLAIMCGEGIDNENKSLVSLIKYLELENKVRLLGVIRDIPQILNVSKLLVSTSLSEGFPNVVGEAMSCGTYCIVTDAGDSIHIIGDYGSVIPKRQPQQVANEIIKVLDIEKVKFDNILLEARNRVEEEFSIGSITKKYEHIYTLGITHFKE
jgi:glycosyltransferase involved in cell wall biosynthesis